MKVLSISSTWLFFALIVGTWLATDMGFIGFTSTAANIGDHFTSLNRFVTPPSETHVFYLFWRFAWSIMTGQFVSRFFSSIKT